MDRSKNTKLTFLIGSLLAAVPLEDAATSGNSKLIRLYPQDQIIHEKKGSG